MTIYDQLQAPIDLQYFPLLDRLQQISWDIERPERSYDNWNTYLMCPPEIPEPLEHPQMTITLKCDFDLDKPSILTESWEKIFLKLENMQKVYYFAGWVRHYELRPLSEFFGEGTITFEGFLMQQFTQADSMFKLSVGSVNPSPIWLQEYQEGRLNIKIKLSEGMILL